MLLAHWARGHAPVIGQTVVGFILFVHAAQSQESVPSRTLMAMIHLAPCILVPRRMFPR